MGDAPEAEHSDRAARSRARRAGRTGATVALRGPSRTLDRHCRAAIAAGEDRAVPRYEDRVIRFETFLGKLPGGEG